MRVQQPLTLLVLALLSSSALAQERALERGAELLAPFKTELKQALRAGLAEGPVEAIDACRTRAPEIADELSRDEVRLGRTSDRLRNPANVPPDWVAPILAQYLAQESGHEPKALELPGDRLGVVEPILLQPLCLTCHGESIPDALSQRIQELYPEDQAVGFRVGELRGVFWVSFPAAE